MSDLFEYAACREADPELWFSFEGSVDEARALAYCSECPVRSECLALALEHGYAGLWGVCASLSVDRA